MPKIISYTPAWLSRPSSGFQVFANSRGVEGQGSKAQQNGRATGEGYEGPRRTIATRGIEIFVVVDNEIRWSELCMLKDDWEEQQKSQTDQNGNGERGGSPEVKQDPPSGHKYRVCDQY